MAPLKVTDGGRQGRARRCRAPARRDGEVAGSSSLVGRAPEPRARQAVPRGEVAAAGVDDDKALEARIPDEAEGLDQVDLLDAQLAPAGCCSSKRPGKGRSSLSHGNGHVAVKRVVQNQRIVTVCLNLN